MDELSKALTALVEASGPVEIDPNPVVGIGGGKPVRTAIVVVTSRSEEQDALA